jgi:hypothetical protein
MGITAKYRVTSSIALEATINPDFSQVETDAFQILVNQRYPVFYSEKRQFYMETSKIFSLAGTCMAQGNLGSAVHTRKIVDPSWGAKVRGDLEAFSFSVLASADDWPGRKYYEGEENPFEGKKAHFVIGRSKLGIGSDSYVGTIITNRDFAGGYNRVIGGDVYYRFGGGNNFLKSHFLYTISKDENTLRKYNGSALTLSYQHSSKSFDLSLDYEYFDDDFRMDTAFVRRLGISKFRWYLDFNIYPDQEKFSWVRRMTPFVFGYYLHDITTHEDDYLLNGGVKFSLTKQGSVKVEYYTFSEYWKNTAFKGNYLNIAGEIQLANWINLNAMLRTGDSIYYDPYTPSLGEGLSFDFKVLVQPSQNLALYFQYVYQKLDRKHDGQRLYDLNILISRTTYQINKYLFLRAIVQYDSYLETILTDGLISFTLIPGTVLHLGYGGLYENLGWSEDQWLNEGSIRKYYQKSRSVFFKVSYLFQF